MTRGRYDWIADVLKAIAERDWGLLLTVAVIFAATALILIALRIMFNGEEDEPKRRILRTPFRRRRRD